MLIKSWLAIILFGQLCSCVYIMDSGDIEIDIGCDIEDVNMAKR